MLQKPTRKEQINAQIENNSFKLLQRAISLQQQGKLNGAANIYQRILKREPNNINALNLLGIIANEQQKFHQAINVFKQAINLKPNHASLYTNLGIALQRINDNAKAKLAYIEAININIQEYRAHYNLGAILQEENLYNDAIICFHRVIKYNPNNAKAYNRLGIIYQIQNRADEAIINFRQAIMLLPNSYTTYNKLGLCLKEGQHNLKDAMIMFRKSLEINNQHAETWKNLGICLYESGKFEEAIFTLNKSLKLSPDDSEIHYNLGIIYEKAKNIYEAKLCYENALRIGPNNSKVLSALYYIKHQLCDWEELNIIKEKIDNINQYHHEKEEPFLNIIRCNDLKTNNKIAVSYSQQIKKKHVFSKQKFSFLNRRKKSDKLTIGYISGNFNEYELNISISELFALHNRKTFKVNCYSYNALDNKTARLLTKSTDQYFDVNNYTNIEIARSIYQDKVDLLIDLTAYCPNNRINLMALRPAPIQINYLGFPGTTGADFYNYIITNNLLCKEKEKTYYTESFAYLPNAYLPIDFNEEHIEHQLSKEDFGLPNNVTILSSFNDSYKFDQDCMNIWANILHNTPNSILWLLESNKEQKDFLTKFFQKQRINPDRIYYTKPCSRNEHLAKVKLIDLNLDPIIYSGPIATSNALYFNIPTITLAGQKFSSRLSASILNNLNLKECITHTNDEYQNKIIELINDPIKLRNLKNKIKENKLNTEIF